MTSMVIKRAEKILSAENRDPNLMLKDIVELLHTEKPNWDWVGIYVLDGEVLKLGPYIGHPTEHVAIQSGDGVCGTAVKENSNQIVEDVSTLDNYIACSLGTRSEIVVLIKEGEEILGQFDIDSDEVGAFDKADEALLEQLSIMVSPWVREYKKIMHG